MTSPADTWIPDVGLLQERSTEHLDDLRQCLSELVRQQWFEYCFQQIKPQPLPAEFAGLDVLRRVGLVDVDNHPQYQINTTGNSVCISDAPWHFRAGGVFPWNDESELLLDYANFTQLAANSYTIIDPACGCGHTIVGYSGRGERYGMDVNPRAGRFVAINAMLNELEIFYTENNIFNGLPAAVMGGDHRLLLANLPSTLSPKKDALPNTSDAGTHANTPAIAMLRAASRLPERWGTVVLGSYSLGNDATGEWSLLQAAQRLLPECLVTWNLTDAPIWRVNGKKQERNPLRIRDGLAKKAECRVSIPDSQREEARQGYRQLIPVLESEGWNLLGYGLLTIRM